MKQLQYEVNIKLNFNGIPEEASCECAAGEGIEAHCKHIAVVLLAAENIAQRKTILLHEAATSQLQTFHRPSKKYYATPLLANKLPSNRKIEHSVYSPYLKRNHSFDKKAYQCRFQSLVLNYPGSSMPLKQLYPAANQHGICFDHDYLNKSIEDLFLESMCLLNLTEEKIINIEMETRGQSTNAKWHDYRKTHITASIFHTVCHLKTTTLATYSNQILNKISIKTRAMVHGTINEKVAIAQYMKEYDVDVTDCGLFLSQERPYLGASPDGLLGPETIVEVKCPYASRDKDICPISVPFLQKDEDGQLILKKTTIYYAQIQGQLYVTKRKFCNLIVYTYQCLKVVFVERDDQFIMDMLVKLDHFYEHFFKDAVIKKYLYKE